jgi:hypothetical protein
MGGEPEALYLREVAEDCAPLGAGKDDLATEH